MKGDQLAIQVAEGHPVTVHQIQRAHAAAGQRLRRVAAHAAHAENSYPETAQALHGFKSQQQPGSGKFVLHEHSFRS